MAHHARGRLNMNGPLSGDLFSAAMHEIPASMDTGQAGGYFVKNTFLSTAPDFPQTLFPRQQTCPGRTTGEPSVGLLGLLHQDVPELNDDVFYIGSDLASATGAVGEEQLLHSGGYANNTSTHIQRRDEWFGYPSGGVPPYPAVSVERHQMPVTRVLDATSVGHLGEFEGKTTVMMRHLPNKYTRALLIEELGRTGFQDSYDFIYLPIDASTHANKGYAFINFVDPAYAKHFKTTYEGCLMPLFNSTKYISVCLAALQGFEANYAHYSTARCSKGNPAMRPLFFRQSQAGVQAPTGGTRGKKPLEKSSRNRPDGVLKFCPSCGGKVQRDFRFCAECGKPLPTGSYS